MTDTAWEPLLRAPPFPDLARPFSVAGAASDARDDMPEPEALFAPIRSARVGGSFWAAPASLSRAPITVLKPGSAGGISALAEGLSASEREGALWIGGTPDIDRKLARIAADLGGQRCGGAIDPWSVLRPEVHEPPSMVVAHGSDEWIALARIAGVDVRVLSPGRFGAPGLAASAMDARIAAALQAEHWHDPFDGGAMTQEQAIALLSEWRRILEGNGGLVAASGMAWWKRAEIRRFLWKPDQSLTITLSPARAIRIARKAGGAVAIWPSRVSPRLEQAAQAKGVSLVRVEDGFVRSVGLGSNLVPPSSIVVDRQGIHFDPSRPSDLETILAHTRFLPEMLGRADSLRQAIVASGISKYGVGGSGDAGPLARTSGKRVVLVPGQVEDDMSVLAGGGGLASNLELIKRVRRIEPDAEIWWRPHPDVDAGHRVGAVPDADALQHADRIVRGGSMATLLDGVDAVHVLTSLTGFEALMRGREVVCHGTPFYAGWGLTRDLGAVPDRRGRQLTLDALVAGVLILYPRYLDPVTGLPCPPEVLIRRMAQGAARNRQGWIAPIRHWQGRMLARLRQGVAHLRPRSR